MSAGPSAGGEADLLKVLGAVFGGFLAGAGLAYAALGGFSKPVKVDEDGSDHDRSDDGSDGSDADETVTDDDDVDGDTSSEGEGSTDASEGDLDDDDDDYGGEEMQASKCTHVRREGNKREGKGGGGGR